MNVSMQKLSLIFLSKLCTHCFISSILKLRFFLMCQGQVCLLISNFDVLFALALLQDSDKMSPHTERDSVRRGFTRN